MTVKKDFDKNLNFDKYTGFGAGASTQGDRLLNKDGSFNVELKGLTFFQSFSPFHHLITLSSINFSLMILGVFILINLFFSMIYYLIGIDQLQGIIHVTPVGKFIELFTFSAQTLTTVGYGRINPIGYASGLVAAFESLLGLSGFALVTGLLYGRFARPHAKLLYSSNALIAPFQQKTALMFRIANLRKNQLVECEAILSLSFLEKKTNTRRFVNLVLEYAKVNSLPLSWTIVHPIDDKSPVYGLTSQDVIELQAEFILSFKAFDDTYAQLVYTRYSYKADEIIWGAKFAQMFRRGDDGKTTFLQMDKISEYIKTPLPEIKKEENNF
ncbi:MAG: Inward rectifier potassium channel Irk [Bacteroidia bacterium]|nr:Inward rectifier potassium channel Irk [Bacteroidia bacterium]